MRIVRSSDKSLISKRHRGGAGGDGFDFADLGADHHARQRRGGFLSRIAGRIWWRCRTAVSTFIELVRNVQKRAALALEPEQHGEKLVGFLRRQHRGRLIEDQRLPDLHQRAHDLDALALADRQPPDFAVGIASVVARHLRQPRMAAKLSTPSSRRDVFRDRQVVEQREMLEHHGDALGAVGGPVSSSLSPIQRNSPALGWIRPYMVLTRSRLAGAVFPKSAWISPA